jgi:hypothetical protein
MKQEQPQNFSSTQAGAGQTVVLHEIVVTVEARRHNPSILNPDFLIINRIVPSEWELAESPICVEPHAEVHFKNGVKIVAEFEAIGFSEAVTEGKPACLRTPPMAESYVKLLPHVDYTGAGLEIRGDVAMLETDMEDFFYGKLIRPGPWDRLSGHRARVGLRFSYPIENGHFILTVAPAVRETGKGDLVSVVFFGGTLRRQAIAEDQPARFGQVLAFINQWAQDVDLYLKLVNDSFLSRG